MEGTGNTGGHGREVAADKQKTYTRQRSERVYHFANLSLIHQYPTIHLPGAGNRKLTYKLLICPNKSDFNQQFKLLRLMSAGMVERLTTDLFLSGVYSPGADSPEEVEDGEVRVGS